MKLTELFSKITIGDIAACLSLALSVIAIVKSTKRYELTGVQRSEILEWYNKVVFNLITLRHIVENNKLDEKQKYLAELSALVEVGRFFFPNVKSKENFGSEKPTAYRGLKDVALEFLVYSYDICKMDNANEYINHLVNLEKLFTSRVFDVLAPKKYMKLIKRNTVLKIDDGISLDKYLKSDPSQYKFFFE